MDEQLREQVALFRYGLIVPILNGQVLSPKDYLAEITAKKHQVPHYGEKVFTQKTIKHWLLMYRRYGFDGLKPRSRSDQGLSRKLSPDFQDQILALRKAKRNLPLSVFYDELVRSGEIFADEVSYYTVYRLLKKHGLVKRDQGVAIIDRKRFAYDEVNHLWQGDYSVGPYLELNGKKHETFLFAFIDDCSRLVPFAQFFFSEKFDSLKTVFQEALIRRGIPKMVYVDNGKIYRSNTFHVSCASLGIVLCHTQPYDAASKGKIERFFRTVKTRFIPTLQLKPVKTLDELNQRFWQWLEEDYHRKIHASLGMTPLDKYLSQQSRLRLVEDPKSLEPLFLQRDYRKVKHDGTFTLKNKLYEVPANFAGQRVEIRFNEEGNVFIYENGQSICKATLVNFADNAHLKRSRGLSMRAMGGTENV